MKTTFMCYCALLLGLTLVCACKKNNTTTPSNMTLITQTPWKYDTAGIGTDNSGTIALALPAGSIKDCEKDNILIFKTDGTGTEDEGATKCDSANAQTHPFTWSFNNAQSAITSSDSLFTGFGGSITITSLTETQLHLMKTVTIQSIPVIVDIYLKH